MRSTLVVTAIVISALLVPVGVSATWLSRHLDDTDAYVETVGPLADEPELRAALADRVTTAVVAALQEQMPMELPEAVTHAVQRVADAVVESAEFPRFWRQANTQAHREFLAIMHEDVGAVDEDGWVVVDLRPLFDAVVEEYAAEQGIPPESVPSTAMPVRLVREETLVRAQDAYQVLDAVASWVPVLWLLLVAVAVAAARGVRGRLRAAAAAALGSALGGLLVLLLTPVLVDVVVEQAEPAQRDLVRLVVEVVVESLSDTARWLTVAGAAAATLLLVISAVPRRRAQPVHP